MSKYPLVSYSYEPSSILLVGLVLGAIAAAVKKTEMPKFDIPVVTFIVAILFAAYFFIPTSV